MSYPQQQGAAEPNGRPDGYQGSVDVLLENYTLGRTLGVGSFGKVKVAEHKLTGQKVAVKILNRKKIQSMDMEEKVRREIKIFSLFLHPHIIRLYEVIKGPSDIFVVMEYVKCGELFDYIVEKGRLVEEEARHFFQQLISGLEYCHRNMVVHRDLKPENLLLDANHNIKIADFGLSNVMRDGHFLKTSCGSPNYAAPEVISGKLYAGPEVDVWSCGVILYALLCGSLPFDDENIPCLFKKIKNGIYTLPTHLSPGARDLIPRMLFVDPLKRITIPEIRQHPWFTAFLPRYLAVMQVEPNLASHVDEEAVRQTIRFGFDEKQLRAALRARAQTKATVTYFLQVDNQTQGDKKNYLQMELSETSAARLQYPSGMMSSGRDGRGKQPVQTQRLVAERHWRLGVKLASSNPRTIVLELQAALTAHQVAWKRIGPFNYKCKATMAPSSLSRPRLVAKPSHDGDMEEDMQEASASRNDTTDMCSSDGAANEQAAKTVKLEVQIYKIRLNEYMVDMQRLSGDSFLYIDVCANLMLRLQASK